MILDAPVEDPRDESIADLVTRLVEDAQAYARAETALLKEIARHRAERAKNGAILLAAGGLLLLLAALSMLLGLVLGLATLIGPLAAGLVVAAVLGVGGFVMVRIGSKGVRALKGDEEEQKALARGEAMP